MTASINSEASKSYKSLLELYLKTNSLLNKRRKIDSKLKFLIKYFRDSLNSNQFFVKNLLFCKYICKCV